MHEKPVIGSGAHTWPAAQLPWTGASAGAQARLTRPHAGGATTGVCFEGPHAPPVPTEGAMLAMTSPPLHALTSNAVHAATLAAIGPPAQAVAHAPSAKNWTRGAEHDTPLAPPHVHAEHCAAGATKSPLPSNAGALAKPGPHAGAGPDGASKSATGPVHPAGGAA
jgi:hypothetical protein